LEGRRTAIQPIDSVIEVLLREGSVAGADGVLRPLHPVALPTHTAAVLGDWVLRERAVHTIEIGLAFAFSALHICRALLLNGQPGARHVVTDPHQLKGYASAGIRVLEQAGVQHLVEFHPEESQLLLPRFIKDGRSFDLGFVDGNHRFDYVFVDLFFLGRLIRKGGAVIVDDYDLPGIRRAVAFFIANLGWTVEAVVDDRMAVVRTAAASDARDFRFFADF